MKFSTLALVVLGSLVSLASGACGSSNPNPAPAAPPAPPAPVAPGAGPTAAPSGTTGKVVERTFHSDALGVDKRYLVYLPAAYDAKPTTKWPVFYYLHGITGDEKNWVEGGHIDQAADRLGLQAIIVMPDGDDAFYTDSAKTIDYDACMKNGTGLFMPGEEDPKSTCVKHFSYETYIIKELIGDVDSHYHTNPTGAARGIAGMSMGGYGAWSLGLRHPDLFAAAASHSGYIGMLYMGPHPYVKGKVTFIPMLSDKVPNPMVQWVVSVFGTDLANWKARDPEELIAKMTPGKPALYLDCGTEDQFHFQDVAQYIHDTLTDRHIEHAYFIGPGGHNFGFWGPREVESLKWLTEHVAKP